MDISQNKQFFYDRLSEIYRINSISALLSWDQWVYMPPLSAQGRSEQIEFMQLLSHQKLTDPAFGEAVDVLSDAVDSLGLEDQVNVREISRELTRQRKLPDSFISEKAKAESMGYSLWTQARPANDFGMVLPALEKIVELVKQEADLVGYKEHPYDALLDIYEPGATLGLVKPLLMDMAKQLPAIVGQASQITQAAPKTGRDYDKSIQLELCKRVASDLGYSFETGRIDPTAHPFMTTLGPKDSRITTRFDSSDYLSSLYSTIHETGHALYELGLEDKWAGTPMGSAASLGIHESQSRTWENIIGRSREFCAYLLPVILSFFPDEADYLDENQLWKQINNVRPTLIRTEADEITYNQHIVIRMLLEEELVTGDLQVKDLPGAWNDLYEAYLGIKPQDDKDGVLQDVHWYSGSIGYFPTYALGNIYNSMIMQSAKAALPNMPKQIAGGDFAPILGYLREAVHKHGMRYQAPELIERITGRKVSANSFVTYLKDKFA